MNELSFPQSQQTAVLLSILSDFVDRGGPVPSEYETLASIFDKIALVRTPADQAAIEAFARESRGAFDSVQTNQGFVCLKPHGYHGDFEIIERIYKGYVSEVAHLKNWDLFFHWSSAPRAVRGRKEYFIELVQSQLAGRRSGLAILNIASGPCTDILEMLQICCDQVVSVHCVDQDGKAIERSKSVLGGYSDKVTFEHRNAFRLRPKKQYDLVWSAGLFDYLSNDLAVRLMSRLLKAVVSGGQLVVGNFCSQNVHRTYMEFGGWALHHREASNLRELAFAAGAAEASVSVQAEASGINLFLHIQM